jgi:hypothetical protein
MLHPPFDTHDDASTTVKWTVIDRVPQRALKPCGKRRCGKLVNDRFCEAHKSYAQQFDTDRYGSGVYEAGSRSAIFLMTGFRVTDNAESDVA